MRLLMVNAKLKPRSHTASPLYGTARTSRKYGVFSVNKSFSKPFEFAENSRLIRFECAQKPEQPLQAPLLVLRCGEIETSRAGVPSRRRTTVALSLIHISEPTRQAEISYAVFCLKKK